MYPFNTFQHLLSYTTILSHPIPHSTLRDAHHLATTIVIVIQFGLSASVERVTKYKLGQLLLLPFVKDKCIQLYH